MTEEEQRELERQIEERDKRAQACPIDPQEQLQCDSCQ